MQCPRCQSINAIRKTHAMMIYGFCPMCGHRWQIVRPPPGPAPQPPDTRLDPWLRVFPALGDRDDA